MQPQRPDNSGLSPLLHLLREMRWSTGMKALEAGWGREGQRAGGCRVGAGQRFLHPQGTSLGSPALARSPQGQRMVGIPSLCLFPCNDTSACNLRQVGEEKKRGRGKKKEKRKNSAVILASASSSLSSPASQEPRHRHPALVSGLLSRLSLGLSKGTNPSFWPGGGRKKPWEGRENPPWGKSKQGRRPA